MFETHTEYYQNATNTNNNNARQYKISYNNKKRRFKRNQRRLRKAC